MLAVHYLADSIAPCLHRHLHSVQGSYVMRYGLLTLLRKLSSGGIGCSWAKDGIAVKTSK